MAKTPSREGATKDRSPKIYQREKIDFDLKIRELDWTPKQREFFALASHKDTRIIFVSGPAGSSKTLTAVRACLGMLQERRVSDIVCVRAAVESADSKLGYLPGDLQSKYDVYMAPFSDKFEELLSVEQIKRLQTDGRITNQPINFCRGLSFTARAIIMDEMQCATFSEITTLVSRMGKFSKMIICADPAQSDLPHNKRGGFQKMMKIFGDEESKQMGIHCFEFDEDDIVRSELCKYIVKKLSHQKKVEDALYATNHPKVHENPKPSLAEDWVPRE